MKKKLKSHFPTIGKYLKLFKVLKLCLIFCVCNSVSLHASTKLQNKKLNVDYKNESLQNIIIDLEKRIDLVCFYNVNDISKAKNISIKLRNATVHEIFSRALKNTDLKYTITNNAVVINKKNNSEKSKLQKNIKIKGKVKDQKGRLLPGVSVVIKGTNIGVSTDSKGVFSIAIPKDIKNPVLVFSFIGLKTKEVKIEKTKELNIVLIENKEKLEEVIVNGFKTVTKEHFTGNATVVSKKDLLKTNSKSVISALQVFDPSFRIKENSNWGSDPNNMPEFNIRGESSIGMEKGADVELLKQNQRTNLQNNPNLPIFVLDGFEVSVQTIYDMDMNRIQNMTILKDAAATSLYGSRAANGVIVVTTVAPEAGKLRVSYNLNTSLQLPDLSDYDLCNAQEKLAAEIFAGVFEPENPNMILQKKFDLVDKTNYVMKGYDTDWLYQPLRNVFNHKHSLYVEGGSGNMRYGFDVQYDKNDGVMKGSYRNRYGIGFFFDYNFKNIRIKNKISYTSSNSENSPYGNFSDYVAMNPYYRLYDDNGEIVKNYDKYYSGDKFSPLYKTLHESYYGKTRYNNIIDNLSLYYDVTDNLRFTAQFNVQKKDQKTSDFLDPNDESFLDVIFTEKGTLDEKYEDDISMNLKTLLTFKKGINKHFINVVGGFQARDSKISYNSMRYKGFQIGKLNEPQNAAQQTTKTNHYEDETRLVGFIGSFNYSYDDIYLFDGSFRYDGSSRFGSNKRFAPFWSFGFGINVHKYNFVKSLQYISRLKLRASYGSVGKVSFPSHTAISTYEFDQQVWYMTGSMANLMALGNADLKWETTNTFDGGFDLGLFNGKVNIRANYYNKETVDLISDFYLRHSTGFKSYKINSGEIVNKGFEVNINAVVLRTENLIVNVYGNVGANKNEITKLSKAMEEYNNDINDIYYSNDEKYQSLVTKPLQKYYVGASTTAIYAVKSAGIDPCNGKEKFIKKNGRSTYTWCKDDQVVVGDRSPDASGSFGFNIGFKGLYVNTSFLYAYGGQKYNSTIRSKVEDVNIEYSNVDKRVLTDRWKNPGDIVPYLDIQGDRQSRPSSRFVQDDNYISFNSLSVGYDFSDKLIKKWGLSRLGLRLNLNDIARWSTIKLERGLNYPYARNYSLNLNMSF